MSDVNDRRTGREGRARRRWRGAGVLGALALVLVACGSDDDAGSSDTGDEGGAPSTSGAAPAGDGPLAPKPLEERGTIKMTIPAKYETFASVYVADALGEFDAENLDVEIVDAPSTDALPMLQRGDIQVQGCGPSVGFVNSIAAGIDTVWAAPNSTPAPTDEPGLWVSEDLLDEDGEVDPDKLLDATVGLGSLQMGSSNALPVSQYLDTIGLELTDLDLSPLAGGDLLAAFQNGAVKAAWLNSPLWEPIKAEGNAVRVQPQGDEPLGGYCLGPSRDDDAAELQAFFRALARTNATHLSGDYHQDDAVVAAISEATGISVEDIRRAPALTFDPELRLDPSVATDLQDVWLDAGLLELDEPLTEEQLVDQSLVEAALR